MDKSSIRKEIAALINSIKEHSDNIGTKEHIPQLELELILSKIEKLYQKSIVFNYLNSRSSEVADNHLPVSDKLAVETAVVQEVNTKPSLEAKLVESSNETPVPVDLFGASVQPPVVPKPKTEKKQEKVPEQKASVNQEQLKNTGNLQKPSIGDIRAAIGINDKFRFINQLFDNNAQEYEIAVQQLNGSGNYEHALEYFSSLQSLYNWNNEAEAVKDLFDLIERRYPHE